MLKLLYHCFFIPQTGSTLLLLYAYVHPLELLLHGRSTMAKTRGGSVTASRKSAHLAERGRQQPQIAAGQMPSGSLASQLPSPLPSSTPNPPTSQSPSQHYRCPSHSPFHQRSPSQLSTAGSHPCPRSPGVAARAHPCPLFFSPFLLPNLYFPRFLSLPPKFPLLLTLFLVLVLLLIPN